MNIYMQFYTQFNKRYIPSSTTGMPCNSDYNYYVFFCLSIT